MYWYGSAGISHEKTRNTNEITIIGITRISKTWHFSEEYIKHYTSGEDNNYDIDLPLKETSPIIYNILIETYVKWKALH
jgi:hypothetical protein